MSSPTPTINPILISSIEEESQQDIDDYLLLIRQRKLINRRLKAIEAKIYSLSPDELTPTAYLKEHAYWLRAEFELAEAITKQKLYYMRLNPALQDEDTLTSLLTDGSPYQLT